MSSRQQRAEARSTEQESHDVVTPQTQRPDLAAAAVSYTHLDVYKRQEDFVVGKAYGLIDQYLSLIHI